MKGLPAHPSLYQINTRVWLTGLSKSLGRPATLEPIYEAVFEGSSYAYRPGSSPHKCLEALGRTIQQKKVSYVVESDVKRFFDKVNHEWMIKFLRHRIGNERVIRLIIRMLKSGILEDGLVQASEEGTPQGFILSPPRKQVVTEKTNFFLQSRKTPVYSKNQIGTFLLLFSEN